MPKTALACLQDSNNEENKPVSSVGREVYRSQDLKVLAMDTPNMATDGMCHHYDVVSLIGNKVLQTLHFQNGYGESTEVNGIGFDPLLAILEDRLRLFQKGPFPSMMNEVVLASIISARAVGVIIDGTRDECLRVIDARNSSDEEKTLRQGRFDKSGKELREIECSYPYKVFCLDKPDFKAGGTCHKYLITDSSGLEIAHISFQHGPVKLNGVTGMQHVEVFSIIEDMLRSLQLSPFQDPRNEITLMNILAAKGMDQERTKRRALAGTEGFNLERIK